MLIACPECEKQVSDRAPACNGCGFPVAEHLAEVAQAARIAKARASRERHGEVDCVPCQARGYRHVPVDPDNPEDWAFEWCVLCESTGRVVLCRSSDGYYAVPAPEVEPFIAGDVDADERRIFHLGEEPPPPHRFPKAGKAHKEE